MGGKAFFWCSQGGANLFFWLPDVVFISNDHVINATSLMGNLYIKGYQFNHNSANTNNIYSNYVPSRWLLMDLFEEFQLAIYRSTTNSLYFRLLCLVITIIQGSSKQKLYVIMLVLFQIYL